MLEQQAIIVIPEIADFEVRRELLRANKLKGIRRLDRLLLIAEYLPITTSAMRRAAEAWATVRRQGRPTAEGRALNADMILVGQALSSGYPDPIVATTNVGHLQGFVEARVKMYFPSQFTDGSLRNFPS